MAVEGLPKRRRLVRAARPEDEDELDDGWADGPAAECASGPCAEWDVLDDAWADSLAARPARNCAVPASWADPFGLKRGGAAAEPALLASGEVEAAGQRAPLERLRGAQRDGRPAWMTAGVGVGTKILGESTGELLKPGLTRAELARIEAGEAQGPAPGADPFGDVFREQRSAAAEEAAPSGPDSSAAEPAPEKTAGADAPQEGAPAAPAASSAAAPPSPPAQEPAPGPGAKAQEDVARAAAAAPEAAAPDCAEAGGEPPAKEGPPDPRTVIVKNISFEVQEDQFELDMEECGDIADVRWPGAGIATVTFMEPEGAQEALKLDGDEYWGRPLRVEYLRDARGARDKGKAKAPETEAIVKNIPRDVGERSLHDLFKECGEIESLRVPRDSEGQSKGVAFITFRTEEAMLRAVALEGLKLDGRSLTVEKVRQGGGKGKDKSAKGSKGKGSKGSKGKGKSGGKGSGKAGGKRQHGS